MPGPSGAGAVLGAGGARDGRGPVIRESISELGAGESALATSRAESDASSANPFLNWAESDALVRVFGFVCVCVRVPRCYVRVCVPMISCVRVCQWVRLCVCPVVTYVSVSP